MKKVLVMLLIISLFFIISSITYAEPNELPKIRLKVSGACNEEICGEGYKIDGTSYVPIRLVMESLGAEVNWDDQTQTVSVVKANQSREDQLTDDQLKEDETKAVYKKETEVLYLKIEKEIKQHEILAQYITLSQELSKQMNNTQWIDITEAKLRERQVAYKEIAKKIEEYQLIHSKENTDIFTVIDFLKSLKDVNDLEGRAILAIRNYLKDKNDEQYKSFLLERKYTLDIIEKMSAQMFDMKITLANYE